MSAWVLLHEDLAQTRAALMYENFWVWDYWFRFPKEIDPVPVAALGKQQLDYCAQFARDPRIDPDSSITLAFPSFIIIHETMTVTASIRLLILCARLVIYSFLKENVLSEKYKYN